MKTEKIKIEEDVAHQIWSKGIRSPPRKIRVRMSTTEDGAVLVSRYEEGVEEALKAATETPEVEESVGSEAGEEKADKTPEAKKGTAEEAKKGTAEEAKKGTAEEAKKGTAEEAPESEEEKTGKAPEPEAKKEEKSE